MSGFNKLEGAIALKYKLMKVKEVAPVLFGFVRYAVALCTLQELQERRSHFKLQERI